MRDGRQQAWETYVFDVPEGRRGAAINRLCSSFRCEENRQAFLADEAAYCGRFGLAPDNTAAALALIPAPAKEARA